VGILFKDSARIINALSILSTRNCWESMHSSNLKYPSGDQILPLRYNGFPFPCLSRFNYYRAISPNQDCSCPFAQNHSSIDSSERLPPEALSGADAIADTRRTTASRPPPPHDQAIVQCLIRHQILGHFYCRETHRAITHQSVGCAGNAENRC